MVLVGRHRNGKICIDTSDLTSAQQKALTTLVKRVEDFPGITKFEIEPHGDSLMICGDDKSMNELESHLFALCNIRDKLGKILRGEKKVV